MAEISTVFEPKYNEQGLVPAIAGCGYGSCADDGLDES